MYCISCRRCNCLYIRETGRRLREHFSEHLRSIRNRSRGFPVAEHFNSASHSLDDIMVCGLKQCAGSNISRKQHEMRLIFKLGTLRPNGLCLARVTPTRAKTVVFQFASCACFPCVRTHTNFCIAWPKPSTEEGPSPKRLGYLTKFDTFLTHFQQCIQLFDSVTHRMSFFG